MFTYAWNAIPSVGAAAVVVVTTIITITIFVCRVELISPLALLFFFAEHGERTVHREHHHLH